MKLFLPDYLPEPEDLSKDLYQAIWGRISNYLTRVVPDVDTSPNSVVGDLIIRPLVIAIATEEVAVSRLGDDMDISMLLEGKFHNEEFAKSFLRSLGASKATNAFSYGYVTLVFEENKDYTLPKNIQIRFRDDAIFQPYLPLTGNIVLKSTKAFIGDIEDKNIFKLLETPEGFYEVDIPVVGVAPEDIERNSIATLNISVEGLNNISNPNAIRGSRTLDSVVEMAKFVSGTSHSPSFTNRSGIKSYFSGKFPFVKNVTAVMPSDKEMVRDARRSIFGTGTGNVDIIVRPNIFPIQASNVVRLSAFNIRRNEDRYMADWGGMIESTTPPLKVVRIVDLETNTEVPHSNFSVFAKTNNIKRAAGASCAFSSLCDVGVLVKNMNTTPIMSTYPVLKEGSVTSGGTTYNIHVTSEKKFNIDPDKKTDGGFSIFNTGPERKLSITFQGVKTINRRKYAVASLKDDVSGAVVRNAVFNIEPNALTVNYIRSDGMVYSLLSGVDFVIVKSDGGTEPLSPFSDSDIVDLSSSGGLSLEFSLHQRAFRVDYLLDPDLSFVENLMKDENEKPIYDALIKYPNRCEITNLHIKFKKKSWQSIDETKIKEDVADYLNNLFYPDSYSEPHIASILDNNGGARLVDVKIQGEVYVSCANFHTIGEREFDGLVQTGPFKTTTFEFDYTSLESGFSATPRNTVFFITEDNIVLDDISG